MSEEVFDNNQDPEDIEDDILSRDIEDNSGNLYEGNVVYITYYPWYKRPFVKIGFSTVLKGRLAHFKRDSQVPPDSVKLYAYVKDCPDRWDRTVHDHIDLLNPALRVDPGRELFYLTPEQALKVVQFGVNWVKNAEDVTVVVYDEEDTDDGDALGRRPKFTWAMAGWQPGTVLTWDGYTKGVSVTTTGDNRDVVLLGEIMTIKDATNRLKKLDEDNIAKDGVAFSCGKWGVPNFMFSFKGKKLWQCRNEYWESKDQKGEI